MKRSLKYLLVIILIIGTSSAIQASPLFYTFEDTVGADFTLTFELDFDAPGNLLNPGPLGGQVFFVDYIGGSVPDNVFVGNDFGIAKANVGFDFITSNNIVIEIENYTGPTCPQPPGFSNTPCYNVFDWAVGDGTKFLFAPPAGIPDPTGGSVQLTQISTTNPIPEPSTMLLLGSGLAGLAAWRSRKDRQNPSNT